jgi:uncharacterized membrane protein
MSSLIATSHYDEIARPQIRSVPVHAPLFWLRQGGRDLLRAWPSSLALGLLFTGIGYALTHQAWDHAHLAIFFTSVFLLVAPFLALGFYALSRSLENGGGGTFMASMRGNLGSIGMYGLTLAFILSVWERLSALMVGLFYDGNLMVGETISLSALISADNLNFTLPWTLSGALLAGFVFCISVITLPLLMDRKVDFVTAMGASAQAVKVNPMPVLLWAMTIVLLVMLGEALWFMGLAVILPILGHATWHAYRDMVAEE